MRLLLIVLLALASHLHAAIWKDSVFNCTANLPDSAGWQTLETPQVPGLTILVAMQHPARQAVFGINVLNNPPSIDPRDPATSKMIEDMLRSFGYQFVGSSTVTIGGLTWKQYPVRSNIGGQPLTGVVRFTGGNEKVYGVSILLGGGKEAAQDLELQQAAGSFRLLAPAPVAVVPTKPTAPAPTPGTPTDSNSEPSAEKPAESVQTGPFGLPQETFRIIVMVAGGFIVLLIFLKIIGGGDGKKK